MREQPAGSVTLVFTDMEGSTRLLRELGEGAYRDALAEHRRVVREAFAAGSHGVLRLNRLELARLAGET